MEQPPKPTQLNEVYIMGVVQRLNFVIDSSTAARESSWYGEGQRSYIQTGRYEGKAAVMKIIADPREVDSAAAHQQFLIATEASHLTAPQIYYAEQPAPGVTIMIMEQLPMLAEALQSPLSSDQRQLFLEQPFAELMKIKSLLAYREPTKLEQLSVLEFVAHRFHSWRSLAERRGQDEPLPSKVISDLSGLERKVIHDIQLAYGDAHLEWTYGLPKPDKFHQVGDRYFLTDFKLVAMRPEGYDLAVAVWADGLIPVLADTQLDQVTAVTQIQTHMQAWTSDWERIAQQQHLPHDPRKLNAMYGERIMGTIYADTIANRNVSVTEIERRVAILKPLLEQVFN